MSKRGRTLTKPTKFSPSKEIFEAAARRRLQAEQDPEEEQQEKESKRVRVAQSTGSKAGPIPKKAKRAPRKILESSVKLLGVLAKFGNFSNVWISSCEFWRALESSEGSSGTKSVCLK